MTVRQVRLSPKAELDALRLAEFLVDKSPRAAARASETIAKAVLSLQEFPDRGQKAPTRPGWRELIVRFGRGAYVIQYRVDDTEVFVARIFHSNELR